MQLGGGEKRKKKNASGKRTVKKGIARSEQMETIQS
jgi:hypothetical protein